MKTYTFYTLIDGVPTPRMVSTPELRALKAAQLHADRALIIAKHTALVRSLELSRKTLSIIEEFNITSDDPMDTSRMLKKIADLETEIAGLIS